MPTLFISFINHFPKARCNKYQTTVLSRRKHPTQTSSTSSITEEPTRWNRLLIADEILDSEVAASIEAIHQEAVEFVKSWARERVVNSELDASGDKHDLKAISGPANDEYADGSAFVPPEGELKSQIIILKLAHPG